MQVDEKEEFGIVTDLIDLEEVAADETAESAPSVVVIPKLPGAEIPFQLRARMSTYPAVLRIPPAAWACQTILAIYMDKIEKDKEQLAMGLPRKNWVSTSTIFTTRCCTYPCWQTPRRRSSSKRATSICAA